MEREDDDAGDGAGGEGSGGEGGARSDDDLPGVGDGRKKHVAVVTGEGTREEHGEVYLRHTDDSFVVSQHHAFPEAETVEYPKERIRRLEIGQHHSACFITTATAGEGRTLETLRRFRDDAMSQTAPGRALVALYYAVSPPVAATLERHPDSRTARTVRWFVDRCAALARRRRAADRATLRLALALLVTAGYAVGLAVAVTGHLLVRARELAPPGRR